MKLCSLFQRWISFYANGNDGRDLNGWLNHHAQNCAECREYLRAHRATSRQLTRLAAEELRDPSPFLRQRILLAVDRERIPRQVGAPRRSYYWRGAFATCAMAIAAFIGVSVLVKHSRLQMASRDAKTEPPIFAQLKRTASDLNGQRLLDIGQRTLDEPLQKELDLMFQDTVKAATTLANNFIPTKLLAANQR